MQVERLNGFVWCKPPRMKSVASCFRVDMPSPAASSHRVHVMPIPASLPVPLRLSVLQTFILHLLYTRVSSRPQG